ncbi:MAG: histone deacetylase family protein [Alphaproteobacteria bacterium]|nr:histone deacetylase family protein [Alphaproteobacteria bacterium]
MTTALITHLACLEHVMPSNHPESPERLRAVLAALEAPEFSSLLRVQAPEASMEQLALAHPAGFAAALLAKLPQKGFAFIDGDTPISPGSGGAALLAAGAVVQAVDMVMRGDIRNAFCAVRPPGHHAESNRAMGFCLFNNVAVGALWARREWNCARIAVIDFDVHHGNGTQEIFQRDPGLFYASTHQAPFYPGTGAAHEKGIAGNVVNVSLQAGAGSEAFRAAMSGHVLPALESFGPDFILISAGFDAHMQDPLANLWLEEADYGWVTREIMRVADAHCAGRVVSVLEGGYDLHALASSVQAHVSALMAA